MKTTVLTFCKIVLVIAIIIPTISCRPGNKKTTAVREEMDGFSKGTYGYDLEFLMKNNIEVVELKDEKTGASLMVSPQYQGRVMTSSASGPDGYSFGWINYALISSGEVNKQFNPVGGEERLWLGPEGGPFSIYFAPGKEQVYENWLVPPMLDTERFDITEQGNEFIKFSKNAEVTNAAGFNFKLQIERSVELLGIDTLQTLFGVDLPASLNIVAYQTGNVLTNTGESPWTRESGLLSIWLLSMFNPSPGTTVFIPFNSDKEGPIVNDDYFGKVPSTRLLVEEDVLYFKIDGEFRSKIGIPPGRARNLCGSYDQQNNILTLLWCNVPEQDVAYVNSKWGEQEDPFQGDVINSYNDGPLEDGSIMGPFYELETSSPAASLLPGDSIVHIQRIVHLQGEESELDSTVRSLFGLSLKEITGKFSGI